MLELAVDGLLSHGSTTPWATGRGRALEAARPLGDRRMTACAAGMNSLAAHFDGRADEAQAAAVEGAALVDAMSDGEIGPRIDWAIDTLAASELYLDRAAQAGAYSDRAVSFAEATGQGNSLPILFWAGLIRTGQGRLSEAAAILDKAVEVARLADHAEGLVWNMFARSLTATAAGDTELALACAEEAVETAGGVATRSFPAMGAGVALAAALVGVDAPGRAAEVMLEAGGGAELPRVPACWRTPCFEVLTRSLIAGGRHDDAVRAADQARSLAGELGTRTAAAGADRASAAVALHSGDPQAAATHALASAAAAEAAGQPVEAAMSRALAGRALAETGDKERAAAELERAAGAFEALGRSPGATRPSASWGARPAPPPAHAAGQGRRYGDRGAQRAGAGGGPAGGRPQDQLADRRGAVPQPEDRRDPHPPPVPEARRLVPGGGRRAVDAGRALAEPK